MASQYMTQSMTSRQRSRLDFEMLPTAIGLEQMVWFQLKQLKIRPTIMQYYFFIVNVARSACWLKSGCQNISNHYADSTLIDISYNIIYKDIDAKISFLW